MKTSLLSFSAFALIIILVSSCSTSSDLTSSSVIKKRRYLKGYQVSIKGSQKHQKRSEEITANLDNVQPKEIDRIQSPKLAPAPASAQASVSNEITQADLNKKSVFETPSTPTKTLENQETSNTNFVPVTKNKREKNSFSRRALKSKIATTPVPQSASGANMVLYIILAIILPPLAVGLLYGIGVEFLISLLLTLLFWVPGVIYAIIMVLRKA